jgi:branched-subunit amino acid transport protein
MAQDNRSFESTLHDVVYSIDAGTGLKIIRVTLYVLIMLVVIMLYTATQFRGLKTEEAMDYAQLGRNMSLNHGMATKCVRPLTLWKMSQRSPNGNPQIQNHPDLYHPPAYPAVLAVGFKFFSLIGIDPFEIPQGSRVATMPAEQWVILPVNHLFTILTGWIVFALGKRLFSREIGFLGMTIFFLSDIAWKDSISGLNLSMASFFIVAAFHAMVVSMLNRRDKESTAAWTIPFVLSVVFAAVAFLTRYITCAAVPGIALFAWLMSGRFRGGTRFAVLFVVLYMAMVSPWLYRNIKVSGNPLGMAAHTALADTQKYPGKQLDRQLNPEFSFKQTTALLKKKWVLTYSEKHGGVIPGLGGGVLMALFITTFFYNFVRPQVNYLRWGLGLSLLLTLGIAGFFSESSVMMIHAFWPFAILYGMAFFYILIDRLDVGARLYTTGLKCLIVLLSIVPFGLTLMPPHASSPHPPYWPPLISRVSNWLTPREVICTDMPWATAWYGDRISILLPKDVDDFYIVNDEMQYISGLYVTAITKNKPFAKDLLTGSEKTWRPIVINGQIPPDFPLKELISLTRAQDQIFLSDHDRWSTGEDTTTP